eukprot:Gb_31194 [translate_table: standard]
MLWLRQAKTDIMSASRFAFEFIFRGASISSVSPEPVPIQATAEKLQKSFSKDDSELGGAFSSHMGSPLAERI